MDALTLSTFLSPIPGAIHKKQNTQSGGGEALYMGKEVLRWWGEGGGCLKFPKVASRNL